MVPRHVSVAVAAAVLGSLHVAPPVRACDSSACLLVTRGQNGVLGKGALRLDLSMRGVDQNLPLQGSSDAGRVIRPKVDFENQRLTPAYHIDLGGKERFLQVEGAYGLSDRTTLLASFPLFARRSYEIGHPPFFETFVTEGNGDLLLGARHALGPLARPVVVGLSVKIPTGRYQLVSVNRGDVGILDPMLQPGSGSFDAAASVQYTHRLAGLDWTVAGSYQRAAENDLAFRFGDEAIASLSAGRSVISRLSASVQVKIFHKGRSSFLGQGVDSTGYRTLYATPGLRFTALRNTSVYGFLQIPIHRYVNETQLGAKTGLLLGVTRTF